MNEYDDIINMKHHVSKKHQPMSLENRAAQFSPFAALTGYDEVIKETGRTTLDKALINEDKANDINNALVYLSSNLDVLVNITYFLADNKKQGGSYIDKKAFIKKIDMDNRKIIFDDSQSINIDDIVNIEI